MKIPVESFDSKYIAFQHVNPIDIHGWFVLNSQLDIDILRHAIETVCIEFPILKSHVVECWINPYFETMPTLPALHHSVIEWDNVNEIPKELLRVLEEKIDLLQGPPIQFYYFESNKMEYTIFGLKINHSVGDGLGGLRVIDLIAENYTAIKNNQAIERPINRTDRSLNLIYQRLPRKMRRRLKLNFLKAWFKFFFMERRPDRLKNCPYSNQITVTPLHFFETDTKKIKAFARQNKSSINILLIAAILWAFYRWNGKIKKLRVLIPQDLRLYARGMPGVYLDQRNWLPLGNMVGVFYINVFEKDFKTPQDLIKAVQKKITFALQTHQGLTNVIYLALKITKLPIPLISYIFSKIGVKFLGKFILSSTLLTNGGAIPSDRCNFGGVKPILFSAILPSIPGLPVIISSTGTKNTISIALTHNKYGFDHQRFINYLKEFLLNDSS